MDIQYLATVRILRQAKLESGIEGSVSRELYGRFYGDISHNALLTSLVPEEKVAVLCMDRQCFYLSLEQIFGSYLGTGPNSTYFPIDLVILQLRF